MNLKLPSLNYFFLKDSYNSTLKAWEKSWKHMLKARTKRSLFSRAESLWTIVDTDPEWIILAQGRIIGTGTNKANVVAWSAVLSTLVPTAMKKYSPAGNIWKNHKMNPTVYPWTEHRMHYIDWLTLPSALFCHHAQESKVHSLLSDLAKGWRTNQSAVRKPVTYG